ncbi:MAG: glycosyltransferase family 4 protein [Candidatus Scalindua sp.]
MKVLVVSSYKQLQTFEEIDVRLLQKHYQIKTIYLTGYGYLELVRFIPQLLWAEIVICWFVDRHSFRAIVWCKRLGKKSVVIAGGYDVANTPDIPYGIAATRPGSLSMVRQALLQADMVVANSRFIKQEITEYFEIDPGKVAMIYHGIDTEQFHPGNEQIKERLIVTVASINKETIKLKRLDLFVLAAKAFPDCKFWVVGPCQDEHALTELQSVSPNNVRFTGPLYGQYLIRAYQRACVYVQISRREGFGMALAEAMACACVPVATPVAAIPEVVGDCGFMVKGDDLLSIVTGIRNALNSPLDTGLTARERIVSEFSIKAREQALYDLIEELCGHKSHKK